MFVTNGNRRPKPIFKTRICNSSQTRHSFKVFAKNYSKTSSFRFYVPKTEAETRLVEIIKNNKKKGKEVFVFYGNVDKINKEIDVSVYAIDPNAIDRFVYGYGKNNDIIYLKSNFIFDDEEVGVEKKVSILENSYGEWFAYQNHEQALNDLGTDTKYVGRYPFIFVEGIAYLAIEFKEFHTNKKMIKKEEVKKITLSKPKANAKKNVFNIEIYKDISNSQIIKLKSDIDLNKLDIGRYRAELEGVNKWIIIQCVTIGKIIKTSFFLFDYESKDVENILLIEL